MRTLRAAIAGLVAVAAIVAFQGGASAASTDQAKVRQEVTSFVAHHPGAKQISADTVKVGEGHFVTFSTVASRSGAVVQASCPNNAYCWFEHSYYGGNIEYYTSSSACGTYLSYFVVLNGKASSWWNNSYWSVTVVGGFWELPIYTVKPIYSSVYVGDGNNDKNHWFCTN